ncbi:MAG: hypothetical protein AB1629_03515 [Candidatus Omnitrophota bacterium]
MDKVAIMNEARANYRFEREAKNTEEAKLSFEKYKNDPLFVAGVMLYWAEGTRLAKYRKYQLTITNSDPELLEIYCNFVRRYFTDVDSVFRAALYIYKDIDESKAKFFWSSRLKIPLNQFIKTQILPSRSLLTKTKLTYGTCCVYINSKDYLFTMQVWIESVSNIMRR